MNFGEMFPSNYLTQDDFPAPRTLVMAKVTMEEVQRAGGKARKPVLHFQGGCKPMVLNKANALAIAKVYGQQPEAWAGKSLQVYADATVKMKVKVVGGIRVRVVPTNRTPANGSPPAPKAEPPKMAVLDAHKVILDGFETARSEAKLDELATWGKENFDFTAEQEDQQSDAYHNNRERISGVKFDRDIP
jgi:hypothetical protein